MRSHRTSARIIAAAVGGLLVLAGAAGAQTGPGAAADALVGPDVLAEGDTTVRTAVNLLSAELVAAGAEANGALGTVVAEATNAGNPLASLALDGLRAGDQEAGRSYSTAGGPQQGSARVPVEAANVSGAVELVDYAVRTAGRRAEARTGALQADLSVLALGALADSGDRSIQALADAREAVGDAGVRLSGITITLEDLLSPAVLDQLPLGPVLGLADLLPVRLPADPRGALVQVRGLRDTLRGVVAGAGEVEEAEAALRALVGSDEGLAAAEAAVAQARTAVGAATAAVTAATGQASAATAAQGAAQAAHDDAVAAVAGAQASVDAVQAQIAERTAYLATLHPILDAVEALLVGDQISALNGQLGTLNGQLAAAQSAAAAAAADLAAAQGAATAAQSALAAATTGLAGAQADLAAAEAALAPLLDAAASADDAVQAARALVDETRARFGDLLAGLPDLLEALPDLEALREEVRGALAGVPVLEIGELRIGVRAVANSEGGSAVVDCGAADVRLLGRRLAQPTCPRLEQALAPLAADLDALLDTLPLRRVSADLPVVVEGLRITEEGGQPGAEGVTRAFAGLEALRIAVPPVTLRGAADLVVEELRGIVAGLTGDVPVAGASTRATQAAGATRTVAATAASAGGRAEPPSVFAAGLPVPLPGDLVGPLEALDDRLAALPGGEALDGLGTTGVDLRIAGVSTEAVFVPLAAGPVEPVEPVEPPTGPAEPAGPGAQDPPGRDAPAAPGSPGAGSPGTPAPSGPGNPVAQGPGSPPAAPAAPLPKTGGGAVLAGLALLALAGGLRPPRGRGRPSPPRSPYAGS